MKKYRNYKLGSAVVVPPDPEPTANMKFAINLAPGSNITGISVPKYKYGKEFFVSIESDDGIWRQNDPVVNFISSLTHTDGCGNNIPYRAAIAINSGTGIPGDVGYNANFFQREQMRYFIDVLKWDFENHGDLHGSSATSALDLQNLHNRILLRTGYKMAFCIVPGSSLGFTIASEEFNYWGVSSGNGDTADLRPIVHKIMPTINGRPIFLFFTRESTDEWGTEANVEFLKDEIDLLDTGQRTVFRLFTHSKLDDTLSLNGFKNWLNHAHDMFADRALVCSTREALEFIATSFIPRTVTYEPNRVIVEIKNTEFNTPQSALQRWFDFSCNLQGTGDITGVELISGGIQSYSFNPDTKQVNINKEITNWN